MTVMLSDAPGTIQTVAGRSTPSNRERVIRDLLERYHDLTDPQQTRAGRGEGEPLPLMPVTYTPTVRELERLLTVMRQDRHRPLIQVGAEKVSVRRLWWHVSERYLRCQVTLKDVPVKRKAKHGKTLTVLERRAVVTPQPGVNPVFVDRGIRWLAEEWGLASEPMLPKELLAA